MPTLMRPYPVAVLISVEVVQVDVVVPEVVIGVQVTNSVE